MINEVKENIDFLIIFMESKLAEIRENLYLIRGLNDAYSLIGENYVKISLINVEIVGATTEQLRKLRLLQKEFLKLFELYM